MSAVRFAIMACQRLCEKHGRTCQHDGCRSDCASFLGQGAQGGEGQLLSGAKQMQASEALCILNLLFLPFLSHLLGKGLK